VRFPEHDVAKGGVPYHFPEGLHSRPQIPLPVHGVKMADKRRRKSLGVFRQKPEGFGPPLQIPATASAAAPMLEKTPSEYLPSPVESDPASPRTRPRTLQKSNRTSFFGSLRSLHSLDEDEKLALTRSDSKASSFHEDVEMNTKGLFGHKVLHYGDVQTSGSSMFRRKTQFIVLTESHLIRFRSAIRAAEMFPSIPSSSVRSHIARTSSASSYQELQMSTYSDITSGVPLEQVIGVYRLDDGRLTPTIEISYLDESSRKAAATQLSLTDAREALLWINAIRSACEQARLAMPPPFHDRTIEHLARVLERERDYDPEHFRAYKVVQRSVNKSMGRASAEDLTRLGSASICYLVLGLHKIHLLPLQRSSTRSSSTSLSEMDSMSSYAIVTLTSVKVSGEDDTLQLSFKHPAGAPMMVQLASHLAGEIALQIKSASEYLRPEWLKQPFFFEVPAAIDERSIPFNYPKEDHDSFDRTLIAYCAGYDVDTSRICYSVDYNCEDAPRFQLLPALDKSPYSSLELLAVFRALRYNESFSSISFSHINLTSLRHLYDPSVSDVDSLCTRSGHATNINGHIDMPMLCQEIRALGLKSRRLRRLDFSFTFPGTALAESQEPQDCGILEALVPLCKRSLTNVDWIVLSGIRLSDGDLNFLVDAASERQCHLRAVEIGECGLSVHDIDVLLSTLACQESTVEVIDISGAQGRFSPELFQRGIGAFTRLRRLNLTRVHKTAGPEPLIAPEALFMWRLEALYLSQTTLNENTVDSISAYLTTQKSEILRELHMNQCGLTGHDLATFFRSMTWDDKQPRQMHVSVNENRLKMGNTTLFRSIGQNYGPTSLSMRMMDFEKENHFRELINALKRNTTLRSLDISRASLPYDASLETCEALKELFATNHTLEELDISGEHAHLDATRFGIGLNVALRGLENNKSLRLLRIEHQGLGLQGASTLADVLTKNQTLVEIHCEHNEINLQSFTALVNALQKNKTILFMSDMANDRAKSIEKVRRELEKVDRAESPRSSRQNAGSGLKKAITGSLSGKGVRGHHKHNSSISSINSFTDQDVTAIIATLNEKWDAQVARMQKYLFRNYCIANGEQWHEPDENTSPVESGGATARQSPSTSMSMNVSVAESSLAQILRKVRLDRTPTGREEQLGATDYIDEKLALSAGSERMVFGRFED
jgi:Ran GTPase-activating protein (RanGAP) involved in mRNA processing and transport